MAPDTSSESWNETKGRLAQLPTKTQPWCQCRWNLVSTDASNQDTWEIVLTANKAVSANDEVLLSYGERSNDEFFGAYGFVPPRNPHEEMVLFSDIVEALEWHHHFYPPTVSIFKHSVARQALLHAVFGHHWDIVRTSSHQK